MPKTLVYLSRPQLTSAFEVELIVDDAGNGHLIGSELDRVTRFLRISEGVPRFDLEYDGRLFARCHLRIPATDGSLPFSYESMVVPEPLESDPNASYT